MSFAILPDHHKFSVIGLATNMVSDEFPMSLQLGVHTWAFRRLPIGLPDHWRQWLGSLTVERIQEDADLFLLAVSPTSQPGVLDQENEALRGYLHRIYHGLLISVPGIRHYHGYRMSGAVESAAAGVREFGEYEDVHYTAGTPKWRIEVPHLRRAIKIAEGIDALSGSEESDRVWRITHAFYSGLTSREIGVRLHQFVRTIEGFVIPPARGIMNTIRERTAFFIGPGHEDLIGTLYKIRSKVEHLEGPFAAISETDPTRRNQLLCLATLQVEMIAHDCLSRLFLNSQLWPYFKDDDTLRAFWALPEQERRMIWGGAAKSSVDCPQLRYYRIIMTPTVQSSSESSRCRLCGSSSEVLTLEHVPPKSTGNRGPSEMEAVVMSDGGRSRRVFSNGVALRVLCSRCNNNTGSRLGTGFGDFSKQVQRSGWLDAPTGGVFVSAIDVFPARVLRQLLLCYLCAQPRDDHKDWEAIREFIRSRGMGLPEECPRVSLYFNASSTYRIAPICSVGAIDGSRRNWAGSEIAAPGLGVLFSIGETQSAIASLTGAHPLDISHWAQYPFDRRESVLLRLPRLRVEEPHPIGFGRRADFERWQDQNHIVWLVAKSEYPESVTSTAVIWRPSRRRR